jgi:ubiquinone/menaquinone biosynthesis C-methylase UbiE
MKMINICDIYSKIYDIFIGNSEKNPHLHKYIRGFIKSDDLIYDGACGTGIFSIELSPYVKKIYACDLSKEMINNFNRKIKEHNIDNIETDIQDINNIEFDDNTFDVAITPNIIHLLDNPEKALNELKRVVKPDGIIIIPTFITKVTNPTLQKIGTTIFSLVGFNPNSWTEEEYLEKLKNYNMNIQEYRTFKLRRYECTVIIKNEK